MSLNAYTSDQVARARERAEAMHALAGRGMTLTDIAAVYKVSKERVRQILEAHFPDFKAPRGRPRKAP